MQSRKMYALVDPANGSTIYQSVVCEICYQRGPIMDIVREQLRALAEELKLDIAKNRGDPRFAFDADAPFEDVTGRPSIWGAPNTCLLCKYEETKKEDVK